MPGINITARTRPWPGWRPLAATRAYTGCAWHSYLEVVPSGSSLTSREGGVMLPDFDRDPRIRFLRRALIKLGSLSFLLYASPMSTHHEDALDSTETRLWHA